MVKVTALFWDVGGVILSNGWDRAAREQASRKFKLDWEDFQDRHELASPAYETGQITLEEYLKRTIFYRARRFTPKQVKEFMFAQSRQLSGPRAIVSGLARTRKYFQATINNEGMELNLHRIERFGLRKDFDAFFSSCFVGARKPEQAIYRIALEVTQRDPRECVFVDDRPLNLECACRLGIRTIHYRTAALLRADLARHGVACEPD